MQFCFIYNFIVLFDHSVFVQDERVQEYNYKVNIEFFSNSTSSEILKIVKEVY